MQFGSVAFFKVLIKTILCIAFFVPLILCVIFAVVLWNKGAELEETKFENEKLSYQVQVLGGEKKPTVEGFYKIYSDSGLSDDDLIAYINGIDIQSAEINNIDTTDAESSASPAVPVTSESAETQQPSEETIAADETVETTETQDIPAIQPDSSYASLYEDMAVRVPASYVREEGVVYLTFDDGPSDNTYSVLYYLDKYDIKATFFVVPRRTEECYDIMRQIVNKGHSIGVHSTTHEYKEIYASVEAFLDDFHEAWTMIYEATGVKTEIFRFPGGSLNDYNSATRDAIIEEMARRGFRYYDWNVDSNDAGGATWTEMYNGVRKAVDNNYRSVILMHDSAPRKNTVLVLEDIIKALINKGYKFDKINNNTQPVQFIGPYA